MREAEPMSRLRASRDLGIALGAGALCLVTAYWLINRDFALIYAMCFVYTAAATWCLSSPLGKNAFLSLSVVWLMLAVGEVALSYATPAELEADLDSRRYSRGYSQPLRRNGGELGYEANAGRTIRAWKMLGSQRIYDVTYTIDAQGLRQVPGLDRQRGSASPVVFFGGSFAFGEGLDDDQTLASFVAARTNWSRPILNFAFVGYGPHQMLRSLELGRLHAFGYDTVETAVYVAIPDHANRAAGESWWDPTGPRYVLEGSGSVQYRGPFAEVPDDVIDLYYRYLQIVQVARRSRVIDRTANLVFGAKRSEPAAKAALMAAIVARAAALLGENYQADLVVLFWDNDSVLSSLVLSALRERGIRVMKVSELLPGPQRDRYRIPGDGHPNAAANESLAAALVPGLELDD
jgi:hypothetical protein